MKIDKKIVKLLQEGFQMETLEKMSEKNIDYIYNKLFITEQNTSVVNIPKNNVQAVQNAKNKKQVFSTYENKTKTGDMVENKKANKNASAVCNEKFKKEFGNSKTSELTNTQKSKYAKCINEIKGAVKEDYNLIDNFIENQISKIVENHTAPQISKKDLLAYLKDKKPLK